MPKCNLQPSYHPQICPLILTELERLSLHELHMEGSRERGAEGKANV